MLLSDFPKTATWRGVAAVVSHSAHTHVLGQILVGVRSGSRARKEGRREQAGTRGRAATLPAAWGGSVSYRGVFTQLAEGGEGFLVGFADLLCEIVQLRRHLIAFRAFLLRRLLLLLVPIIPDSWKGERRQIRGH